MKILVCRRPQGAFGYITDGWINALRHAGFKVARWDGDKPSWTKFAPDLYLGCSGHRQKIPQKARDRCKVAIHVNPYGTSLPGIDETKDAIDWTLSQSPDVVFGYGFERDRHYWSTWDAYGIPWVPMACGGDATKYSPLAGSHNKFDIVYLGGRWQYKAKRLDQFLIPMLESTRRTYCVRGWGEWPNDMCDGGLEEKDAEAFLASGKVGPCISEPHTGKSGIDIPERVFKVILSGLVAIHDPVPGILKELPNLIVTHSPIEFANKVEEVLHLSPGERKILTESQFADVVGNHTYHHRLASLLKHLRFTAESELMMNAINRIRERH